ncbi:VCBS repeat-containing protein, partial [bacterium]
MLVRVVFSSPLRLTLAWVMALGLLGCASSPAPAGSASGAEGKAQAAPDKPPLPLPRVSETKSVVGEEAALEPPDGKWLVDDRGREYFTTEVERVEGQYKWMDEARTRVRLAQAYGLTFDVASYDETKFLVKIYRPVPRPARPAKVEPSPEEVEAAYRVAIPSADRLSFTPFSEGLPTRGQWRQGFAIADIDRDGHPDIVHGPARKT